MAGGHFMKNTEYKLEKYQLLFDGLNCNQNFTNFPDPPSFADSLRESANLVTKSPPSQNGRPSFQ